MDTDFWHKLNKPILALAPMAGVTDSAYREICKKFGADVTYSEMASVSALFFKPKKTLELVRHGKKERPYVVQLFGKDPKHFAVATKIITEKIKPDGIDINFGCPAKKVFGHGSGCALMPQKKLAREIILTVCENTDLPISIKIRAGIEKGVPLKVSKNNPAFGALEFIKNTQDLLYSAIMVHGRTYEGGFSGPVDFKIVQDIKKITPDKIVLGNGGINEPEEAVKILSDYPALDGLGIARGAWGRPWIFKEIKNILDLHPELDCHPELVSGSQKKKKIPKQVRNDKYTFPRIKKIMLEHVQLIHKNKGKRGLFEIRKHMSWYVKGFPGASEIRRKLMLASSISEIKNILHTP